MVFIVKEGKCIPITEDEIKAEILVDDEAITKLLNSQDIRKLLLEKLGKDSVIVGRLGVKYKKDIYYKHFEGIICIEDISKVVIPKKEFDNYGKL